MNAAEMTKEQRSDQALWVATVGGHDHRAFDQLFDRHKPMALRVAARICGAEAEDAVQAAFLSIWKNRSSYDPDKGNLRSWIMTVVRNRSIDLIRSNGRRRETAADLSSIDTPDPLQTEDLVVDRESALDVRAAVAKLPASQRTVVELGYFRELSQVEIADRLHLPLGTVKGRARAALKGLEPIAAAA